MMGPTTVLEHGPVVVRNDNLLPAVDLRRLRMKTNTVLLYGLLIFVGGCIPVISLQPLYTHEHVIFDEHLIGTWVENPGDTNSTWKFTQVGQAGADKLPEALKEDAENVYYLSLTDPQGRKGSFFAVLVKLDTTVFMDVFPDTLPSGQDDPQNTELFYNAFFFVRAHTFIKANLSGNRLTMWVTDDEKMSDLLESRPSPIAHESADDRTILTASTTDLQAFVSKYVNDDRVFGDEIILDRKPQ